MLIKPLFPLHLISFSFLPAYLRQTIKASLTEELSQYQQLACLRWLIHFRILDYIPRTEDGATWESVATLAEVPVSRLKSVALMTATINFLRVVSPDRIAHSRISAQFLQYPQYCDWAEFATCYSAPIAHAFAEATQRWGDTSAKNETAFNVAFDTQQPYFDYLASSGDTSGLFARYMRSRNESEELAPDHVLTAFDFGQLGEANVVEVRHSSNFPFFIIISDLLPRLAVPQDKWRSSF